jgi:predicted O-methyltransferase YrrM
VPHAPKPLQSWFSELLRADGLAAMGHGQDAAAGDPGLGWLYYALARVVRPRTVVVIGSWRGFVPLVLGRALADAGTGQVVFIDPSLVDGFWREPDAVQKHFASFGLANVQHWCMTTQEFVETQAYRDLPEVGLVFIDGYHSYEQVRFDYQAFAALVPAHGMVLFHDSLRVRMSRIYGEGRAYEHRVRDFIDELKAQPRLQVMDLPFGDGLTLVRTARDQELPPA